MNVVGFFSFQMSLQSIRPNFFLNLSGVGVKEERRNEQKVSAGLNATTVSAFRCKMRKSRYNHSATEIQVELE